MCDGIEVLCRVEAVNPQTFLTGQFETRVVSFSFGSEDINFFEGNSFPVD